MNLGVFSALMGSLTWAIGSSQYAQLSKKYPPLSINFTRACVALPLFIFTALIFGGGISGFLESAHQFDTAHLGWLILSMFASYGLGDLFFLSATRSLGVPGALAISSTFPLFTALVDLFVNHKPLGWVQLLGLILVVGSVVGVVLSAPTHTKSEKGLQKPWIGFVLSFVASFLWAVNNYAVREGGLNVSTSLANGVRMIAALVICSGLGRVLNPNQSILVKFKDLAPVLWIFVFESFGGAYFYMYGITHISLVLGAALSSLAPVMAMPISVIFGLEKLSWKRSFAVSGVVLGLCLLMSNA